MRISVLPDGSIVLPRGTEFLEEIAKACGDKAAVTFCEQAELNKVLVGKRMCG